MPELSKGGNIVVGSGPLVAELHTAGGTVDLSALLVAADGKVRSDDDLVFYNQPSAESGAVRHLAADTSDPERIEMNPAALPADVDRVVLVGSCDPDDASRTFRDVQDVLVRAAQLGAAPVDFRPPALTDGERAVLLLELYRRGETWKLRAIGQGYADGLAGLATDFGIEVAEAEAEAETVAVAEVPEGLKRAEGPKQSARPEQPGRSVPPQTTAAPTPPPMSLRKPPLGTISLDKGSQVSMSLDKADRELVVTATLEWDGGSDQRRRRGADLDLYALFVPASQAIGGEKAPGSVVKSGPRHKGDGAEVVYYKNLGSLKKPPYIHLDGDARVPGCETVRIVRPDEQGYVLLCAYSAVSNGFGSFRSFGAKVVVTDGRGSTVTVPLFENTSTRYWVAIALVDFTVPDGAAIHHVEAYSGRMTERRPVLHVDGTVQMNAGPVEFKRR
ncbi:TerD family protein [Streptomyces sp. ISL-22]|uniref:TerD family protein n=1 Tax=unclassified Streptomyces TaxID=2593676 RepID=UPI001BEBEDAC|nr:MULTISPECIES: TerD family protein [unclassified Streptomyces]MBT2421933.1 TerD family protein [Streptomyces sp. ISL-24]MBT2433483.1 TerD family protein [Streptomyces sp. ISL-22]